MKKNECHPGDLDSGGRLFAARFYLVLRPFAEFLLAVFERLMDFPVLDPKFVAAENLRDCISHGLDEANLCGTGDEQVTALLFHSHAEPDGVYGPVLADDPPAESFEGSDTLNGK